MKQEFARASSAQHEANERYSLDKLNRFMDTIQEQDDQAMVLSLATFLEDTLGRLLLAYFRSCKATKDLVEGFNAPLGTFGSRIKSVYAFGLVTDDQFKDMEILRKVRNHFAHNWEDISFERNDIQALIGQLSGYTVDHKPIEGGPREKLLGTLSTCCMELQVFLGRLVDGMTERAPDVSHRLTVVPPTERGYRRFVK
ncbi:MltR family transcriptional regulator [Burkholderia cepacia]|uniref:MltR family transcriptional regulator n=1 Tax=Burkholderia cepacia TaxID=292 RepID=UPI001ABB52E2|nr:MltR family transcriptional regulator [Burkholderia cepacia]MDN7899788.1 MltR family transcriptional regulator [Burkholderia cepacia]